MKKIISAVLAACILISLCTPFAFAADDTARTSAVDVLYDAGSVNFWNDYWNSHITTSSAAERWGRVTDVFSTCSVGRVDSFNVLSSYAARFNLRLGSGKAWVSTFFDGVYMQTVVAFDESLGVYRIRDTISGLWLVDRNGAFAYYKPEEVVENQRIDGDHWAHISDIDNSRINLISEEALFLLAISVRKNVGPESLHVNFFGDNYKGVYYWNSSDSPGIKGGDYYWVDKYNHPYCCQREPDNFGINLPQDYYTEDDDDDGKYDDESSDDGNDDDYEVGDTFGDLLVDITENQIYDITTGDFNFIDKIIYDESTKTYNIDAHKEYEFDIETNNYYYYEFNYEYTYHVNYTSVTYIGQTAEYNKTYEFYYQLPDGRSSADLTVEELQALNTQIDVLPYIRSADDTSIRALYHFDGDNLDSSYWSYAGSFDWISGASLTYMDAGAFNGALFLDETAHEFNVNLPSNLGSSDFTLQFRYYQSATIAPVTDSHISIGNTQIMQLSGDAFILSDGTTVPTSIGQWTELCFMRKGNTLYYLYNGVCIGSVPFAGTASDVISFVFGTEQQTYKYFDELRVTSKALYDPAIGYTPTSVPYDTNLALVLPDSKLPIADAYWDIKSSKENLLTEPGLDHWVNVGEENENLHISESGIIHTDSTGSASSTTWPYANPSAWLNKQYTFLNSSAAGSSLTNTGTAGEAVTDVAPFKYIWSTRPATSQYLDCYDPSYGLIFPLCIGTYRSTAIYNSWLTASSTYTFSMVFSDGSVESFSFVPSTDSSGTLGGYSVKVFATDAYPSSSFSGNPLPRYLVVKPPEQGMTGKEFVYMELVEGDSTDLTAEYVESVVAMDKDDLNTPSLAVRTDINITGYQIGGVRPSLPAKGHVWALVEDGLITSLQIYNGQAWESVDGRIWTGSRWVPYYAYDVILLKDLYDVVESDPSLDYIYTESGFWKWLQGAWGNMMDKLDDIHDAIVNGDFGSGSGSGPNVNPDIPSEDKGTFLESLGNIFLSIFGSLGDLLTGIFSFFSDTVFGGIKNFFSVFTDGSLFEGFQQTDEEGNTTIALPEGVSAVFAFFAGLFLVLPEEIRLILFFAIGLLIFMGVLKVVIS